jgi:stage V sporulation protein B
MQAKNMQANTRHKGKKANNFFVQGSILAVASIISRLIGLIYRVPLTNIIGDEGMGAYSYAFTIYNLGLIISSYSLPLAVSKLVAARNSKKEYKNGYRIFLCALSFAVAMGLVVSMVLFFGADLIANTFYKSPGVAIPLRILAPTIFVFAIMGVLRGFYQGKNTMIPTSISQLLEQIVNAIVSLVAAKWLMESHSASEDMAAYGAAGATFGTFMGTVVSLLFLAFIFALYKPVIDKQLRRDRDENRETVKELFTALAVTSIPVIIGQTVYQLNGIIDGSLFGHLMSEKGFGKEERDALWGIYSSKYNLLINVPVSIASAMAVAIIPNIVSSFANKQIYEVKEKVSQAIKFNMIIAIPAAVGMGVLASPIMLLLFKDDNPLPANLIRIGSVAIIFYALSTITNAVLQGINRMRLPVRHSAISLVIHIVLVFLLLKFTELNVYVMVIGNITFALLVCVLNWISVGKYLNYKQEVKTTFILPTICSVIMGVFTYFTYKGLHILIHSNAISTIISIVVSCLVYGVLLLVTKCLTEKELYELPMGTRILRLARKFRLM